MTETQIIEKLQRRAIKVTRDGQYYICTDCGGRHSKFRTLHEAHKYFFGSYGY